jgi:hypothetical protein
MVFRGIGRNQQYQTTGGKCRHNYTMGCWPLCGAVRRLGGRENDEEGKAETRAKLVASVQAAPHKTSSSEDGAWLDLN